MIVDFFVTRIIHLFLIIGDLYSIASIFILVTPTLAE